MAGVISEADSRAHFARLQRLEEDIATLMQTKQLKQMRVWVRNVTLLCFTILFVYFVGRPLYWSFNTRYGTQKFHSSPAAIEPAPDQAPLYEGESNLHPEVEENREDAAALGEELSPVEQVTEILDAQDSQPSAPEEGAGEEGEALDKQDPEPSSAPNENEGEEGMSPADVVTDAVIDDPKPEQPPEAAADGGEDEELSPVEQVTEILENQESGAAPEGEEGMSPVDIVSEKLEQAAEDTSPVDVVTEMLDKAEADRQEDNEGQEPASFEPTRKLLWRA